MKVNVLRFQGETSNNEVLVWRVSDYVKILARLSKKAHDHRQYLASFDMPDTFPIYSHCFGASKILVLPNAYLRLSVDIEVGDLQKQNYTDLLGR